MKSWICGGLLISVLGCFPKTLPKNEQPDAQLGARQARGAKPSAPPVRAEDITLDNIQQKMIDLEAELDRAEE